MKIVVALTGASGVIYGTRLVEELSKNEEVFVIISENAKKVAEHECHDMIKKIPKKVKIFNESQIDAPIASSSFGAESMIICPCSMKTLSAISTGYANNLIHRCADIMIKDKKKLVLALRETPFSPIHLENMLKLSKIGVIILPLCPAWYHKPKNLDDIINFMVGKIMDSLRINNNLYKRWGL
jgi:4-hydroxy-3-polyprenylbenzoate decarboxylase